jgi:hypothetical protein
MTGVRLNEHMTAPPAEKAAARLRWQTGRAYRAFRSLETTEAPQRMKIAPLLVGAV